MKTNVFEFIKTSVSKISIIAVITSCTFSGVKAGSTVSGPTEKIYFESSTTSYFESIDSEDEMSGLNITSTIGWYVYDDDEKTRLRLHIDYFSAYLTDPNIGEIFLNDIELYLDCIKPSGWAIGSIVKGDIEGREKSILNKHLTDIALLGGSMATEELSEELFIDSPVGVKKDVDAEWLSSYLDYHEIESLGEVRGDLTLVDKVVLGEETLNHFEVNIYLGSFWDQKNQLKGLDRKYSWSLYTPKNGCADVPFIKKTEVHSNWSVSGRLLKSYDISLLKEFKNP